MEVTEVYTLGIGNTSDYLAKKIVNRLCGGQQTTRYIPSWDN